jgi:hypothetical protein
MNSLPVRIYLKLLDYLNRFIGRIIDLLQQIKVIKPFRAKTIVHYGKPEHIIQPYPVNYQPLHESLFTTWRTYETLELELYKMDGVSITHEGAVLKGILPFIPALPHPIFRYRFGLLYNLQVRLLYHKIPKSEISNYLLVYDFWSKGNYYHWCIDSLCRIWMANEFLKEQYTLLLPAHAPSYVIDSVSAFQDTPPEFIPDKSRILVKEMNIMGYAAGSGRHHPAILKKVRQHMLNTLPVKATSKKRKIYVSRGKQKSRRVSNEQELITLLESKGFETVYFEGMSLIQQIEIMQDIAVFISSHGANMTNTFFLPADAQVLELINEHHPNFCYWSLCSSVGLAYYYQLCPIETSDHVRVNLDELSINLSRMESHP